MDLDDLTYEKRKRYEWRLTGNPNWYPVNCMADVYTTLENLSYHSVEIRVHPEDRELPPAPVYAWNHLREV